MTNEAWDIAVLVGSWIRDVLRMEPNAPLSIGMAWIISICLRYRPKEPRPALVELPTAQGRTQTIHLKTDHAITHCSPGPWNGRIMAARSTDRHSDPLWFPPHADGGPPRADTHIEDPLALPRGFTTTELCPAVITAAILGCSVISWKLKDGPFNGERLAQWCQERGSSRLWPWPRPAQAIIDDLAQCVPDPAHWAIEDMAAIVGDTSTDATPITWACATVADDYDLVAPVPCCVPLPNLAWSGMFPRGAAPAPSTALLIIVHPRSIAWATPSNLTPERLSDWTGLDTAFEAAGTGREGQ